MPSHFTMLGFPAETREEIGSLMYEAARYSDSYDAPSGFYAQFAAGEVELWIQSVPDGTKRRIVGINPHYSGNSRMLVKVIKTVVDPEFPLDGAFYAWANPPEDETSGGDYPFVFKVPDYEIALAKLTLPAVVTVQIAAFARRLDCFETDESYREWQKGAENSGEHGLATEAFIPTGLFIAQEKENKQPTAEALFSGHIEVAELRTNPVTNRQFQYLSVKTFGGTFDIITDPQIVQGQPLVGGVVEGSFWLSGKILGDRG